MKLIRRLLYLIFLLLSFANCKVEEPAIPDGFFVSGVVKSDNGQPLSGVIVNSVVDTTLTDSLGRYAIRAHPTGPIEFGKAGFVKWTDSVRRRTEINVTLIQISADSSTVFVIKTKDQPCDNGAVINVITVEIRDFGKGIGTMIWSRDKVWILRGRVFVNDGQTLTIEPGTIVKGGNGQASSACGLIVARGGKIIANGKPDLPIIFTSETDEIVRDAQGNLCRGTSLSKNDKGLWGGITLCGRSVINVAGGQAQTPGIPAHEPRAWYGGNNDDDNSGILRYVSIRHTGTELSIGNEMNALTLAGVGKNTILEHVETFASKHHGFAFRGGTVNSKYLTSTFHGNDAFYITEGWRGLNQFWFGFLENNGDRGAEHLGSKDPENATPYSTPVIRNATYIGPGTDTGKRAVSFKANAGGEYHNSIFMSFAFGVDIQYLGPSRQDSYNMFENQRLIFKNNILHHIGNPPALTIDNKSALPNNDPQVQFAIQTLNTYFQSAFNGNLLTDPGLTRQFVPQQGNTASHGGSIPNHPFFEPVTFLGCFFPDQPRWIEDWTASAKIL